MYKGVRSWGGWRGTQHVEASLSRRDFLEGSKNRGSLKWHLQRTYLLPGPRLSCAQFDVPCNQLVSSYKEPENRRILVKQTFSAYCKLSRAFSTFQLPSLLLLLKKQVNGEEITTGITVLMCRFTVV